MAKDEKIEKGVTVDEDAPITFTEEQVKKIIADVRGGADEVKKMTESSQKIMESLKVKTDDLYSILAKYDEPVKEDKEAMLKRAMKYATWDRLAILVVGAVAGYAIGSRNSMHEVVMYEPEKITDSLSSV